MTEAEKEFIKYTDPYKQYGKKIDLKIDHSLRVRNLCLDIAGDLGFNDEWKELSAVCGLLHDIGRFEQWRRYGTYNDRKSADHGDLGAELLAGGLIGRFAKSGHNTILKAVKYHNKYRVPNTLSEKNRLFADITRDADKIDILKLFAVGESINRTENGLMSEQIIRTLFDGKAVRSRTVENKDDQIAIRLGFVFDLKFHRSFEIIRENDYIDQMIDLQIGKVSNQGLSHQLEDLRGYINGCIGEKIKS